MPSLRRHEGYYRIDQHGPGIDPHPDLVAKFGEAPVVGPGQVYECATQTCSHCGQVLILNPLRTRQRAYCGKCDRYLCDRCGLTNWITGRCEPLTALLDRLQNEAILAARRGSRLEETT